MQVRLFHAIILLLYVVFERMVIRMKPELTIKSLIEEAYYFCQFMSEENHLSLIGVTDGKAVGTYVEHCFQQYLAEHYYVEIGNSARGIDLPSDEIKTDIKVTSITQPQSSCPFRSARQKIYGLGYNLLVFVYDKRDSNENCSLTFTHCTFIDQHRTADYTITKRIREMMNDGANRTDIISYLSDRNVPGDEIVYSDLADEIFHHVPEQGYLTISNALQWRLQYARVIDLDNRVEGVINYEW